MDSPESAPWKNHQPFAELLGVEVLEKAGGHSRIMIRWAEQYTNRKGDFHGGVIMTLLDVAASEAVRSALQSFRGLSTISLTVNFLATARSSLIGTGRLQRAGRTVAFAVSEVANEDGEVVATAQCAFRIIV